MSRIVESLNPGQRQAVTLPGGPALVLAGAGSGKTRVLTHRVAWLIEDRQILPWQIVAVTFTNKAAGEMGERVRRLLGREGLDVFLGTFHHFCVRLLRREAERIDYAPGFLIYDTPEQLAVVKKVLRERNLSESAHPPKKILGTISSAKNRLLCPEDLAKRSGDWPRLVADVWRRYRETMRKANAFDFDDLIVEAVRLLEEDEEVRDRYQERVRHLLVDEYQDTNHAQYRLILALSGRHRNLMVVGDEDQSIFSWRGADLSNILDFERDFPDAEVIRLEQNYRSTGRILSSALGVVSQNVHRKGKELWTENVEGEKVRLYRASQGQDEARWVVDTIQSLLGGGGALREMAVMYRTHAQSRLLEEELLREGVPYVVLGGVRFYQRREVKDLLAYLALSIHPDDPAAFYRVINVPPRGIGAKTQADLEELAAREGLSPWEALERAVRGEADFSGRAVAALRELRDLISGLRQLAEAAPADEMVSEILKRTQYLSIYERDTEEEQEARRENVEQLVSAAAESVARGESIADFLAGVALQSDVDSLQDDDTLTLMSLHAAKGLEFDTVFLVGLEEGLLPHANSLDDADALEEERRLCYVGMTRARRLLHLSTAASRRIRGQTRWQQPSLFLDEIPQQHIEEQSSPLLGAAEVREADRWDRPAAGRGRRRLPRPGTRAEGEAARQAALASLEKHFGEKGRRVAERARKRAASKESLVPPRKTTRPGPSGRPRASTSFRRGDKVRHERFGAGVVLSVEDVRGDQKLTVKFSGQGVKKFLASHAPIRYLLGGR